MRKIITWTGVLTALTLASGCAAAYHSYSDCYVECGYCPPPPLPFVQYDACACHAAVAAPYLSGAVDGGQRDGVDGHIDEVPPDGRE